MYNVREVDVTTARKCKCLCPRKKEVCNIDFYGTYTTAGFEDMDHKIKGLHFLLEWKM